MASFREALLAKKRIARSLLARKGIYGVGVGLINPNRPSEGACVVIYAGSIASAKRMIPSAARSKKGSKHANVPFRFVCCKRFMLHGAANPTQFEKKIRPIPAGYSIGTASASGTAGLIVSTPSGDRRFIFSNNHVLNENNTAGYSGTYQPGGADAGASRVGRLYRYARIKKSGTNYVDAALSIPSKQSLLNPRYATVGVVPGHVTSYRVGQRLKKVGRTTGLVTGRVESVHTDVQVDYGEYGEIGVVLYRNQTVVRGTDPVSLPGDSGSVWLRHSDNYATAVNYAGSADGRLSISFPVHWVMQVFKTRVAKPNGVGKVKVIKPINNRYVKPLTSQQLKRIKVIQAKSKP